MPTLTIDDREITVEPGATIMEAATQLGVKIPHFCYHPGLSVAGNCRMCMVEVEKMPKPVISCAMPVNEGMVVRTDSEMVRKARRAVMEFLLINHPLDCPVCDQGGECRLQDYALKYGLDHSRFREKKREVANHELGPVIETEMDRCIHCTRCIRFSVEVAGVEEMGAVFRGDHMRVGPFVGHGPLTSELAGNMAEICPVGALNLKPFHFQARGWELQKTDSVCSQCAVGCHTRVGHMKDRIYRIKARRGTAINMGWLCDKGRFASEGMTEGRLLVPMVADGEGGSKVGGALVGGSLVGGSLVGGSLAGGSLVEASWSRALDRAAEIIQGVQPDEVAGLAGVWGQGAEELYAFQDFLRNSVGTPHLDYRLNQKDFSADSAPLGRADLMLNTSLQDMETADAVFLVGADPRFELPLLNLRLRRASLAGASVWSLGPCRLKANLENLKETVVTPGGEAAFLRQVLDAMVTRKGSEPVVAWAEALKKARRPVVLLGGYAINHPQAETLRRLVIALLAGCDAAVADWNGYNRMVAGANAAAAEDMGVVPHRGPGYKGSSRVGMNAREIMEAAAHGKIKVLFLLGVDPEAEAVDAHLGAAALAGARVIWLGAFDSPGVRRAQVVLPGLVHGERCGTLTNCEGRVQRSARVVNGPLTAKEDWRVLRALSERFARVLPYDDLPGLRGAMGRADGHYDPAVFGSSPVGDGSSSGACDHGAGLTLGLEPGLVGKVAAAGSGGLVLVLKPSFYRDTPLSGGSPTLAKLDGGGALWIGSADAKKHGVVSGGRVCVEHKDRSVVVPVVVDDRIAAGTLMGSESAMRVLGEERGGFLRVTVKVV